MGVITRGTHCEWAKPQPRVVYFGLVFRGVTLRAVLGELDDRPTAFDRRALGAVIAGNLFSRVRLGTSNLNSFCQLL